MLFDNATWPVYDNQHDILRSCEFINNQQSLPLGKVFWRDELYVNMLKRDVHDMKVKYFDSNQHASNILACSN